MTRVAVADFPGYEDFTGEILGVAFAPDDTPYYVIETDREHVVVVPGQHVRVVTNS